MLYDYYCAHCGKQLNQDTVLFDMQYLLTGDETKQFNILKFRMTQTEFKALMESGTPAADGYRECSLTLADIMRIVGNRNNLNDWEIPRLTMEEIADYMEEYRKATESQSAGTNAGDDFSDYDDDLEEEEDLSVEEAPYIKPPSIVALEKKCSELVWVTFVRDLLPKDLAVLQNLFAGGDVFTFLLHEENDTDNEGQLVLEGYSLRSGGVALRIKARICPQCDAKVFDHAGTAPQKVVAFVGWPWSGKTSTITALTHYAMNYMHLGFGSEIWNGCQVIDSVTSIELLHRANYFIDWLRQYKEGMWENWHHHWKDYHERSVIFRIRNRADHKTHILTFIALPWWLLEWRHIHKYFPAVLSSDAFVLCVDNRVDNRFLLDSQHSAMEIATDACRWIDELQNMRAKYNNLTTYVPTMLLFTKRDELAAADAPPAPTSPLLPLDRMYLLAREKQQIKENREYDFFCSVFGEYGRLNRAYHAMMRCTAYGYSPPNRWDIANAEREGKPIDCHPPTPKNIDLLMRWLLSVTGCIPIESEFARTPSEIPYRTSYTLQRPQLRCQNPLEGQEIEEAMARYTLFENPGYFDREFVVRQGRGAFALALLRLDAKRHPDTNDRP